MAKRALSGFWKTSISTAALACLMSLGTPAQAQSPASATTRAVPHYSPLDVALGLRRHWSAPQAERFAASAQKLPTAVQALCQQPGDAALQAARHSWVGAMQAWGVYSGVPLAELIERRALRQIDFMPARPALIQRQIERAPRDMDSVGGPAKGLPALEWLLWKGPLRQNPAACAYAVQVARDLASQAAQLKDDSQAAAAATPSPDEASAALAELLNQWAGSAERLRWTSIDKPRRESPGRQGTPDTWPRASSGHTADAWAAHWQALHRLALMPAGEDAPGTGGAGLVGIEAYLRGRGHIQLAERWVQRVQSTDSAMRAIQPRNSASLDKAVRELAQTKRLLESEVAPALDVRMGFSDADGD